MIEAKILADSVNPNGDRLTTFQLTYPRFIHSELLTHRSFSRNAASSRAIPVTRMLNQVLEDSVVPVHWGANEKGMQASSEIKEIDEAKHIWKQASLAAVHYARSLSELGVHKQVCNRLLEPFQWMQTILSGTGDSWEPFFALRATEFAQPEFALLAYRMKATLEASDTKRLEWGEWHLPLLDDRAGILFEDRPFISASRCAAVSYLRHASSKDVERDLERARGLYEHRHMSPFEHVARATQGTRESGNFRGQWMQLRQLIETGEITWTTNIAK